MDTFHELAKTRRSIRAFTKQDIKNEDLRLCAETARYAPSACNSQPWKFTIINDPLLKEQIAKKVISGIYKMNSFAADASAYIAIIKEPIKMPAWLGGKIRNTNFQQIDIGIACSHLILQAQELGIGSCILGWFNERKLKRILKVPFSKKIELLIALGYTSGKTLSEKVLKDKSKTVSFNQY
ncbi:MAG: nitroreductase family protein [Candidatus Omnitrophota bacterium]